MSSIIERLQYNFPDGAEAIERLTEAQELLMDSRRYLTEFGSVEPEVLVRRIDQWRNRMVLP